MANKAKLKYIAQPNLPQDRVALCAVSVKNPKIVSALQALDVQCIGIEQNKNISVPVSDHSDLQVLHIGEGNIIAVPELADVFTDFGFNVVEHRLTDGFLYPYNAELCSLVTPKYVFGLNNIFGDTEIDTELYYIRVKQGYTRCSVAVVSESAYITSDVSIHKLLCSLGLDVLLLPAGDISLPPYAYGFIGGCCGKLAKNILAFAGSLEHYKYGDMVKGFLKRHGIQPLYLLDTRLVDIGGILPLMEYCE